MAMINVSSEVVQQYIQDAYEMGLVMGQIKQALHSVGKVHETPDHTMMAGWKLIGYKGEDAERAALVE